MSLAIRNVSLSNAVREIWHRLISYDRDTSELDVQELEHLAKSSPVILYQTFRSGSVITDARSVFDESDFEAAIWCHPSCAEWKSDTSAFAIEVTERTRDDLIGNVYFLDYDQSVSFVKKNGGPKVRAGATANTFIEQIRSEAHYTSRAMWKKLLNSSAKRKRKDLDNIEIEGF